MIKVVGIGEYIITSDIEDIVKTYALGSCVAVTFYCPEKKVLAMVHIGLSDSSIHESLDAKRVGYFADTAVPFLLNKIWFQYGCNSKKLQIYLFGGAESNNINDMFNIGKRNIEAIRGILERYNLRYNMENVGGRNSRTIEMDVASGSFKLYEQRIKI